VDRYNTVKAENDKFKKTWDGIVNTDFIDLKGIQQAGNDVHRNNKHNFILHVLLGGRRTRLLLICVFRFVRRFSAVFIAFSLSFRFHPLDRDNGV
jgi:hypothetical protein